MTTTTQIRRDGDIHSADGGWYQARWHFSFDTYRDPQQMGVGALRVFNDDRLQPGAVWPMHPHRDIESCTYVVEGTFAHEDSLGNDGELQPGAAQVMRFSSRGARHSERNGSATEPMRFLQFWILPSDDGLDSAVLQRQYTAADREGRLLQIMGPPAEDGLDLAQNARVLVSRLPAGARVAHTLGDGRGGYLYVIDGELEAFGSKLGTGDAAKLTGEEPETVELSGVQDTELILIDVPLQYQPVGVWARSK